MNVRRLFSVLIIAGGIGAAACGCSSSSHVTVAPYTARLQSGKTLPPQAALSFEAAMKCADFAAAERAAANENERVIARAFLLYKEGEERASEALLKKMGEVRDSTLRDFRETLLAQMYFAQGRWKEVARASEDTPADASFVLASAYADAPKEEIAFDGAFTKVPIDLSSSGVPVVEVEVNGVKKKFWFDTGAGLTVIASDAAEDCGVSMIGSDTSVSGTSTSKTVAIMPATIAELKVGTLRVKHHPVMIINKKDLEFKLLGIFTLMKIDGIIGWNLIQQLGWQIDYKNKTLEAFRSSETLSPRMPEEKNFFCLGYPTVSVEDSAGRTYLFGMDTGAKLSTLTQAYLAASHAEAGETESRTFGGAGGFERAEVQKLSNVALILGAHTIVFYEIYTHEHAGLTPVVTLHGTFGSDIAHEGVLCIDYPHRKIVLQE